MNRLPIFLFFILFPFNVFAVDIGTPEKDRKWEMVKDKNGIQVYRSHTENSKFKSFRAVTRMELDDIQSFVALLLDGDGYPDWLHMLTSSEISETDTIGNYNLLMETRMPWPVKNRLVKVKSILSQAEDYSIRFDIRDPDIPAEPREGFIIVPETHGYYELKTVPDSREVEITVEVFADPGGYIPAFLINLITGDFSYFTTYKMKRFIKSEKYQNYENTLIQRRPWVVNGEV